MGLIRLARGFLIVMVVGCLCCFFHQRWNEYISFVLLLTCFVRLFSILILEVLWFVFLGLADWCLYVLNCVSLEKEIWFADARKRILCLIYRDSVFVSFINLNLVIIYFQFSFWFYLDYLSFHFMIDNLFFNLQHLLVMNLVYDLNLYSLFSIIIMLKCHHSLLLF